MPCSLASQGPPDENLSSLLEEGGDPETQLWLEQGLWFSLAVRHRHREIYDMPTLSVIILQS